MIAVRESHPVERPNAVDSGLLNKVAGESEHVAAVVLVAVLRAGAPFAKDDGSPLGHQVGLHVAYHLVNLLLGIVQVLDVQVAVNLKQQVVFGSIFGQFHLLQRVLQV